MKNAELQNLKTYLHRNLHRGVWSYRTGDTPPTLHASRVMMWGGVELRVRPGGRERARRQNRKNVHAFAIGRWASALSTDLWRAVHFMEKYGQPVRLTYSPYHSRASFSTVAIHQGFEAEEHPVAAVRASWVGGCEALMADHSGTLWGWGIWDVSPAAITWGTRAQGLKKSPPGRKKVSRPQARGR
jgi:hypothetical protein